MTSPELTPDPSLAAEPSAVEAKRPKDSSVEKLDLKTISWFGLFLVAFFFTLQAAKSLFLPIFISILLGILLNPAVRYLHQRGIPRALTSGLLMSLFLGFLGVGVQQALVPAQKWIETSSQDLGLIRIKVRQLMKPVKEVSQAARQVEALTKMPGGEGGEQSVEVKQSPSLGKTLFDGTQDLLFGLGVVVVLTHFLLSSGDRILAKLVQLLPRIQDKRRAILIAKRVQRDLSTHLLTISAINLCLGALVAGACYAFGLPNPMLWGVMAALLNFVPYLGAVVGCLILAAASLLTFDEPLSALALPAIYMALTIIEGSYVTPLLLGRNLSLNPAVIFLALFFWGWLWGIAGALLAIPILLSLKIVCDGSPRLKPLGDLIGH